MNPLNLALGIILSILLSCILAYVYALAVNFIPIIYFNILITIFLGISISYLVRFIFRITKIRFQMSRIIIVIITVIAVTYFQWTFFLDLLTLDGYPSPKEYILLLDWIFDPGTFFGIIQEVNEYGTWGIGSNSNSVNGWMLTLIWIAEIGLTAFPSFKLLKENKIFPFSETYNKWYPKYTLNEDFKAIHSSNGILSKLNEDVVEALKELGIGQARKYSKVHIYYIPQEQYQYLSIETFFIKNGESSGEEKVIILDNYRISTSVTNEIKANFKMTKEKINVI